MRNSLKKKIVIFELKSLSTTNHVTSQVLKGYPEYARVAEKPVVPLEVPQRVFELEVIIANNDVIQRGF